MKILRFLKGRVHGYRATKARRVLIQKCSGPVDEITRDQWSESLRDPTAFYLRCFHYFHNNLPADLRAHREYFTQQRRGFGEDAFHAMWFLLFREFRPQSFLEIGVFRGQSLSLASMLSRQFKSNCVIQGVSPFSTAGDSECAYRSGLDYHADTLKNFAHFALPEPSLLRAYSTDEAAAKVIASRAWSIIFIDGNHDYEVVKKDWELCAAHVPRGGLIVLDDSGLTSAFRPPLFSTAGISGPSRMAQEIDRTRFPEIMQVGHNRVFQKIVE